MNRTSPSWGKKVQIFNIIIILLIMAFTLHFSDHEQRNVDPIGCDGFGYARQAQLFRDQGLMHGFNTSITAPQAELLVSLAKGTLPNTVSWYEPIAPHCHHYNDHTGKVILQYPPGTGLILALFPEPRAMPYLLITGIALTTLVLCWALLGRRLDALAVVATCSAFVFLMWVIYTDTVHSSASVPATLLLIPASAWLGYAFPNRSYLSAFPFGLICGLLVSVRLPNAMILAGFVVQAVLSAKLWHWHNLKACWSKIATVAAGLLIGVSPVLISNHVNAGGIFHTTYSSIDASAPVFRHRLINEAAHYYFGAPTGSIVLIAAIFFVALGLTAWANDEEKRTPAGTLGAALTLLLSLGFFVTHSVRIPYYLIPAGMMAIFMVTIELIERGEPLRRGWWLLVLPLVSIWIIHAHRLVTPHLVSVDGPDEMMTSDSVAWADLTSGTFYYYRNRYAAKLNFTDPATQDTLVEAVMKSGHAQYFIVDSPSMKQACDRQASRYGAVYVGEAKAFLEAQVWKLADGNPASSRTCSK
jgi:hypothetical protein